MCKIHIIADPLRLILWFDCFYHTNTTCRTPTHENIEALNRDCSKGPETKGISFKKLQNNLTTQLISTERQKKMNCHKTETHLLNFL